MTDIQARLDEIDELGLTRRMRLVSGPQGPRVVLDGNPVLLLCSNNYLGLADHPRVREAAADAAMRWGVGAGASRLVSGNMTIHRRLEEALAEFARSAACVLFGSGYLANTGVVAPLEAIVALAQRYDARGMVDEAHALGAFGPGGRGVVAAAGLDDEVDVIVGTLGKALGSYGAFACCNRTLAKYLVNRARTLIF